MAAVNQALSRWKRSVRRYLFEGPRSPRQDKPWILADFRQKIDDCLSPALGETAARNRAAEIGAAYIALPQEDRKPVLGLLAREYGPEPSAVAGTLEAYHRAVAAGDDIDGAAAALREALKPRRVALLTRFTSLPDGVKFLLDLRVELRTLMGEEDGLDALDRDLLELFRIWFDPGFVDIARVTWSSPASLLEKLMDYEAIHSIVSWEDLKNRLDRDRRCYILCHPRMKDEPLAILHVALTRGIATNIQALLDVDSPQADAREANTAVFYSVTSPQRGLRGVSFGEHIIKEAVQVLREELPRLETFVTLSPIPGFRGWLRKNLQDHDLDGLPFAAASLDDALARVAGGDNPPWLSGLEQCLRRKCLEYLITLDRGAPLNPVTRFHLRNGASIQHIQFMGDTSANGLRSACGMMVNYGYNLDTLETNTAAVYRGKVPISPALLKTARSEKLDTGHLV